MTAKGILIFAAAQCHICQVHKPLVQMLQETGGFKIHMAVQENPKKKRPETGCYRQKRIERNGAIRRV